MAKILSSGQINCVFGGLSLESQNKSSKFSG